MRYYSIGLLLLLVIYKPLSLSADGIIPERINQIIIQGQFADQQPTFLVVFSARSIRDDRDRLVRLVSSESVANFQSSEDFLAVRLYGKTASKPGRFDYFFGTLHDADRPWNNGDDFSWQDWGKYSPDIWDNVCIAALQTDGRAPRGTIRDVTIRRGGKILFDSRAKQTYPNKRRIDASLSPFNVAPRRGKIPLLNLGERMERFRSEYYELGSNPILTLAYSDLGQTAKRKYTSRGKNWCSEFGSYIYRENQLQTPDPNAGDVHWKNMREFFEQRGEIYPMSEVVTWSNQKKRALIKPGSFVSIRIGESTHSLIFTTWVMDGRNPITHYVGLSGNNKGMVWAHAPLKLPTAEELNALTAQQRATYDQQVYFAVPPGGSLNRKP